MPAKGAKIIAKDIAESLVWAPPFPGFPVFLHAKMTFLTSKATSRLSNGELRLGVDLGLEFFRFHCHFYEVEQHQSPASSTQSM